MELNRNCYVFVVCGLSEYISQLNFSLRLLKKFSSNKIIILTDLKRNEGIIDHHDIIDITTPADLNHHQASIYLKTGLFKFIDLDCNYCYLDNDVLALNKKVDEIFKYFVPPITFAKDHCKLDYFSSYAVNCGCYETKSELIECFFDIQNKLNPDLTLDKIFVNQNSRELFCDLFDIRNRPFANIMPVFRYIMQKVLLPYRYFYLNKNYRFDKANKIWIDREDRFVMGDILASLSPRHIEKVSNFRFDPIRRKWQDGSGVDFFDLKCHHLHEEIEKKFHQRIRPFNWQHWNGGVFLFNKDSKDFLETWHNFTLSTFEDDRWKTRDQGTLAAATWKFGLQDMKTLPIQCNFLADFYKPEISFKDGTGFTFDNFKNTFQPILIHIYHHFGDKRWNIWQYIECLLD